MTAPVIQTRGLGKTFPVRSGAPLVALESIDLAVPEGSFVSIVGPSGCGKSTLLQILGGLARASMGEVVLDSTPINGPAPGKVAIVFQDATLLPWKTAQENVLFPLEIQGVDAATRRKRAERYLHLVGLAEFADRYPHELSGGMRQRVSIARGLAQEPRIILMDEPFGALDEQTRIRMGHELSRIWAATRKTIILVTHSLTEAIFLSDQVLVMGTRPGRILERIDIDLPRPRTDDMIGSALFGALRNRLWHLIDVGEASEPMPNAPEL